MTPIEKQIESVVDGILLDYQNGRDIDKLELYRHPSKEIIIDMIGKLIRLIYPGYALERTYWIYNAKHNLSMLIEDVMYNLSKQISLVLQANMEESAAEEQAQRLSLEFLGRIPQVRAVVQTDVEAAYETALAAGFVSKSAPKVVPLQSEPYKTSIHIAFVYGPDGEEVEFFAEV